MALYEVTLWEKVTHTVTVEADNEEDAYEAAVETVANDEQTGVSQGYYAHTTTAVGGN